MRITLAKCVNCLQTFRFSNKHVPRTRLEDGLRPICRPCVEAANQTRITHGVTPYPIHPEAYPDEVQDPNL